MNASPDASEDDVLERAEAGRRLHDLWSTEWSIRDLVAFHTAHKMQLLAHSTTGYRALGRLVAGAKKLPRSELAERYEAGFMATLEEPATPGRHANVLMHMMGHLRGADERDRRELVTAIEAQRLGAAPLVVPLTLLAHPARRLGITYLLGQTCLRARRAEDPERAAP